MVALVVQVALARPAAPGHLVLLRVLLVLKVLVWRLGRWWQLKTDRWILVQLAEFR